MKNNRYGFRGRFVNSSNPFVQRLLILGDSFVQAAQVNYEQTFGYLLESKISDAQVMQVGIPGWGQGDQLRWLKTYYQEFRPHLVIVTVFLGNDLQDNMKKDHLGSSGRVVTRNGDLLGGRKNDPIRTSRRLALTNSYLYIFIRHRFNLLRWRLTTRTAGTLEKQDQVKPSCEPAQRQWPVLSFDRDSLYIFRSDPNTHLPYYSTFFELLAEFKGFCIEKDIRLIILTIPWHRTLDGDLFAEVLDHFKLRHGDYDDRLPHTKIAEHMQRIGLPYLELRDHFMAKSDPLAAYGNNPHFSPTGHVWTAEALHALISELGTQGGAHRNSN